MPLVIAHRGASGYLPEHTLAAYYLALQQGADAFEPDLVMTRDGVLVARHENELGGTTDVARHARFASRRVTKQIDGEAVTGWFSEDFTLEELKSLRARERIGALRPANCRFDGQFEIATFEEILRLRAAVQREREYAAALGGRPMPPPIVLVAELKHPSHFAACGLEMTGALVRALEAHGCTAPESGVILESFETGVLRALKRLTGVPLMQLLEAAGAPEDVRRCGGTQTFAHMAQPAGLADIATYATGIGPEKSLLIPRAASGRLALPTRLIADSHAQGLKVIPWTFRAENAFLPAEARSDGADRESGDLAWEISRFLSVGVDGFFTDQPDIGVRARAAFLARAEPPEA
ncbi:MAG: glycerophosphodiester phosphodiesterase family protein [Steroidobacteraceae bacterium]